jgi:hypothetical protein
MKIQGFNDVLAFTVAVIVFPMLWAAHGVGWINLPSEALGATVVLETLIVQFYFRKAPDITALKK